MKLRIVKSSLLLVLAIVATAGTCWAQELDEAQPLTDSAIKGFCASMTDLVEWAEDNNERLAGDESDVGALDSEQMQQYLTALSSKFGRSGEAEAAFEKIVQRHGFASTLEWEETSGRIVEAWVAIIVDENKEVLNSGFTDSISEALLGSLSAEQRKEMEKAIATTTAQIEAYQSDVSAADVAVVTRNRALLEEFFGSLSTQK